MHGRRRRAADLAAPPAWLRLTRGFSGGEPLIPILRPASAAPEPPLVSQIIRKSPATGSTPANIDEPSGVPLGGHGSEDGSLMAES